MKWIIDVKGAAGVTFSVLAVGPAYATDGGAAGRERGLVRVGKESWAGARLSSADTYDYGREACENIGE